MEGGDGHGDGGRRRARQWRASMNAAMEGDVLCSPGHMLCILETLLSKLGVDGK